MSETLIASIITGIVSIVVAFLVALPGLKAFRNQQHKELAESRKTDAETSKIYQDMAAEAIKREMEKTGEFSRMQKRLGTLERNFDDVVDILCDWAEGFKIILNQLDMAGISPNWKPSSEDLEKIQEFKKQS